MQKFIIWLKVNWLKILLVLLFAAILISLIIYSIYIYKSFQGLESFSKKQIAGMQAMYMPMFIFSQLLVLPLTFAMYYYFMQGGGLGTFAKNKLDAKKVNVKWADIIGMEEAKRDAQEVVQLLKDHSMQKAIGGNIIKGMLMIGPPGCGKTYLAKAIATECDLPMISAVGSDFIAMFMGQGAARMKSMFKQARELAKIHGGSIIFIDEIDAFARERQSKDNLPALSSADTSYNATVNQFLTEMDGLQRKGANIIVIAATNVNEEELDPAIMRSGRFDRKIRVEKPNTRERAELLKFYLAKVDFDPALDLDYFADKAKWFSAADISNLVREAGVIALRSKPSRIRKEDLETALSRIMISIEKMGGDKILSEKINVKWDDVVGMNEAKAEAWEILKLLKDRNRLKAIGGKIVKGVLMLGPPGCGKTYLAKAIATESGFPFIPVAGSELVGIYIGSGVKRIKEIFKEARALAKAEGGCIIFFDEIDAFAYQRYQVQDLGGAQSHNATVNQFLTEMDGVRQAENNIFVLAATNVNEEELDPAILRGGRIERKIYFTKPNLEERKDLFKFYLSKVEVDPAVAADVLARTTVGFSPADIDNMIREAGLIAMRNDRAAINHKDLSESYDRLTIGALSKEKYNPASIKKTAYHEAGHAIITYLLHPTDDVIKATIRPRKRYLGYIYIRPIEQLEDTAESREHLLAEITVGIAGYAAEKIVYGTVSAGVWGDFKQIMRTAHQMVWELGMGKSGLLGNFLHIRSKDDQPHMSEKTKEILDTDVQEILQTCLKNAVDVLTKHRDLLEYFTEELIKKGDLEHDEIKAIFDRFGLKPAAVVEEHKTV